MIAQVRSVVSGGAQKEFKRMKSWHLVAIALSAVLGVLGATMLNSRSTEQQAPGMIAEVEAEIALNQWSLAPIRAVVPDGAAALRFHFENPAPNMGFYFRHRGLDRAILVLAKDGETPGDLMVFQDAWLRVDPDSEAVLDYERLGAWEIFEVVPSGLPAAEASTMRSAEVADGFMRTKLFADDGWERVSGEWQLKQYGAGLVDGREASSYNAQRSVNPFTLQGQGSGKKNGTVVYTRVQPDAIDYLVEARFFLGDSRKERSFSRNSRRDDFERMQRVSEFDVEERTRRLEFANRRREKQKGIEGQIREAKTKGGAEGWNAERETRAKLKEALNEDMRLERGRRGDWERKRRELMANEFDDEGAELPKSGPPAFLIGRGPLTGEQLGFGWWDVPGGRAWALCQRNGDEPWIVIKSWDGRPPIDNWVRVGIDVRHGHSVRLLVDGDEIGNYAHDRLLRGGFHLHTGTGSGRIELDDVLATPGQPEADFGQPLFVASASFADKKAYGNRDPREFDYWARGKNTFIELYTKDHVLDIDEARVRIRLPLHGNFRYRSKPNHSEGKYRFLILKTPVAESANDILADLAFSKEGEFWTQEGGEADAAEFTLEFGRENGQLFVSKERQRLPIGVAFDGPCYLMIVPPSSRMLDAERHDVEAAGIWHELFEQAPTDWYWHGGNFGMNTRWACQPGWNFMVGKSRGLVAMHSKSSYEGDQMLDFYLSLAASLSAEQQYYIRRDLNIAFCTDGQNLDSGYTLIYGAENNRKTMLMRKGEVIAVTTSPRFRFPPGRDHQQVHWNMWHFECRKIGQRVRVRLNGQTIFDVEDPDPLPGGHLGVWSMGNAFAVSRLTAAAEQRTPSSKVASVSNSESVVGWQALLPDSVGLTKADGGVDVRNSSGGGFFAVRSSSEVDLRETPVLELPLDLPEDVHVNLHLQIDDTSYLVELGAPTTGMQYLLTPGHDRRTFSREYLDGSVRRYLLGRGRIEGGVLRINLGEMLAERDALPKGSERVILTIGNSSQSDYLLAGIGGNHAGSIYRVGQPSWKRDADSRL
ncbi:MAG: hypothetical protein ACI8W8_001342 [Rhodothermales bacterium]